LIAATTAAMVSVNDIDLGVRCNIIGHRFALDPECIAKKLGTPELSTKIPGVSKPKTKTWEENYKFFCEKMRAIKEGRELLKVPDGYGAW
jgi:hypothetical protein